ncbi:hypothetical protein FB451DRAFT_1164030 [Mycena latifolia]|nr:hypothetical protein FB451DRAFT_1164030 [Mycena latifolia]
MREETQKWGPLRQAKGPKAAQAIYTDKVVAQKKEGASTHSLWIWKEDGSGVRTTRPQTRCNQAQAEVFQKNSQGSEVTLQNRATAVGGTRAHVFWRPPPNNKRSGRKNEWAAGLSDRSIWKEDGSGLTSVARGRVFAGSPPRVVKCLRCDASTNEWERSLRDRKDLLEFLFFFFSEEPRLALRRSCLSPPCGAGANAHLGEKDGARSSPRRHAVKTHEKD